MNGQLQYNVTVVDVYMQSVKHRDKTNKVSK